VPRRFVEQLAADQRQLVERGERILLLATPAALDLVVVAVELGEGRAPQFGEASVARRRRRRGAATGQLASPVILDEAAQEQLGELAGILVAAQLEHGPRVAGQHGGRRPAPVGVALGEVGPRVGVDADRHEVLGQQGGDLGVGVGVVVHHVTPVTPRGGDID
jgi:hypothetical protein